MISNGREIIFTELFISQLADFQTFIDEQSPQRGRQVTTDLFNFLLDTVAPNPFMYIEYAGKRTTEKKYRRAVFKRNYIILYKVTEESVTFLLVYHASRNPDGIDLQD